MAHVFTIEGSRGRHRIERGACACVTNPRTGRKTKICKDESGKTRIKGKC